MERDSAARARRVRRQPGGGACLKEASRRGDAILPGAHYAEATVLNSRASGGNRLLLSLPMLDDGEKQYAVLFWSGSKSMEIVKSVAAMVLSTAAHFKALAESQAKKDLFLGVIKLIMGAVDAKDPTTAGHSERVAVLARDLAATMGFSPKAVEEVYLAGLLHDVGKIGVPDGILNFPGKLSDADKEIIRRHPMIGSDLMGRIKLPENVMRGILEHHERMDGKGYPLGRPGASTSVVGRILKIADVYDALRSKRQYKDAMGSEETYRILREGSGSEFDPEILAVVLLNPFSDDSGPSSPENASGGGRR